MDAIEKNHAIDGVMAGLLAAACPIEVGIPSWFLTEMVTRKSFPVKPRDVLGLSVECKDNCIVSDYLNMKGYEFSWGTFSENIFQDEDGEWVGIFEIFPKHVLRAFPQVNMISDLFMWMYQNHSRRHDEFKVEEPYSTWYVISFSAYGKEKIGELRRWLAGVFVPKILPDLISEAVKIVTAEKMAVAARSIDGPYEDALCEKKRFQLCGDPAKLSFNALR